MQVSRPDDSRGAPGKTYWRVIAAHVATYVDPIAFDEGDTVRLTGREDIWDGHRWLWALAPDGREGWIPDSFVEGAAPDSDRFVAAAAYSAAELTCAVGDILEGESETHGWVWARSGGLHGWAPLRNLTPISGPPTPDDGQS